MTISSEDRKAGPFPGDGVTVDFDFEFKVFADTDVVVIQAVTATGAETEKTIVTDYTVTLNPNQESSPGGRVSMLVPPPTGQTITLTSEVPNLQAKNITSLGGFFPQVLNDALDRLTVLVQQVKRDVARSVKVNISSTTTPDQLIDDINTAVNVTTTNASATAADVVTTGANAAAASASAAAAAASESGAASVLANAALKGANNDITGLSALQSINGGQIAGLRNKIINGSMGIDQRNSGSAQTITAAAALAYCVDRWYAYCTGANVTGQRVAGTTPNQYNYRFTGAASVTKIGFAQRIEAANCQELAGQTTTLSVDLANSLLTTVTWTAWYANTADTFGTLASPTRTQIATGTFTVTSTLTRYNAQISIPSAATTGIEIEFSVGAQTSGTWTIGRAQLELGGVASPFEVRPASLERALCENYYNTIGGSIYGANNSGGGFNMGQVVQFPTMRVAPTLGANTGAANTNTGATSTNGVGTKSLNVFAATTGNGQIQVNYGYTLSAEL